MGGSKKVFTDGVLFTITNYIWWLLLANIYFLVVNIPIIFVALGFFIQRTFEFNIYVFMTLLPIGPALTALFSIMGKLVREKDLDVTKDFFKAYKNNFLEAFFYWSFLLTILCGLYIYLYFFNVRIPIPFIKYGLWVAGIIIISMIFYTLPIISRFYFKIKDVIRISLLYLVKKAHLSILILAYMFVFFFIYLEFPNIVFFLFGWSILAFLIMFTLRNVLDEIQRKYVGKNVY